MCKDTIYDQSTKLEINAEKPIVNFVLQKKLTIPNRVLKKIITNSRKIGKMFIKLILPAIQICHLHYINVHTLQAQKVNMNAMGDAHVSFTCMDLALSNDEQVIR